MPTYRWRAFCQWCGKPGNSTASSSKPGVKPNITPHISGPCKSSPTGQHAPRWEEA